MGMMKVQKHTGLVAIRLTSAVDNYRRGRTHGFLPTYARKILQDGNGEKAMVPDSIESTEVWDGISMDPDGEARPLASSASETLEPGDPGAVAIPDKWDERNHFANIATAKQIVGPDGPPVKTKADAEKIIRDELDRRAAAGK